MWTGAFCEMVAATLAVVFLDLSLLGLSFTVFYHICFLLAFWTTCLHFVIFLRDSF